MAFLRPWSPTSRRSSPRCKPNLSGLKGSALVEGFSSYSIARDSIPVPGMAPKPFHDGLHSPSRTGSDQATTNHKPLSASLAASLPSILFFSFPAPLKPPHPFPSPPAYCFGIPPFPFRLPIQLGSTKPPTIRRSSPIRKPPVHSFVNPIPVWRIDVYFILRTLKSSQ